MVALSFDLGNFDVFMFLTCLIWGRVVNTCSPVVTHPVIVSMMRLYQTLLHISIVVPPVVVSWVMRL